MLKLKKLLAVMLAVCLVTTIFAVPVSASDPKVFFSYGSDWICATYDIDNIYYDSEGNCVLDCYVIYLSDSAIAESTLTSVDIQGYYMSDYVEIKNPVSGVDKYVIKGISSLGDSPYLTEITIPDTVSYISSSAFDECPSLTTVNFSDDNQYYSFKDGVIYNADKTVLICYLTTNTRSSFTVPDTVIEIGEYAFKNNSYLTSVTLPDSVTTIDYNAFYNNSNLTTITMTDSVTSISYSAFSKNVITDVYYGGVEGQWENIYPNSSTAKYVGLSDATIHFASSGYAIILYAVTYFADGTYDANEGDSIGSASTTGGTIKANKTANEGDTVTLTVTPADGFTVSNVYVDVFEATIADDYYTFTMPASDVYVYVEFEENEVVHTFTQDDTTAYSFNYSDYLTDYAVGDTIVITATLESDSYYGGALGANDVTGWLSENYSNTDNYDDTVTVTLTVSSEYAYPYGGGQVQLWWIGGTYVNVTSLTLEKVEAACTHDSLTHVEATPATCEGDGNTEYWYCADCDKYFSDADATTEITLDDTVVEATGHSYEAVVTEPTCTEGGYTTYTCSVCSDTYIDDETEALGHDYTSEVTAEATCTEAGVMTYTCTRGDDSYTEVIEATGHTPGEAVKENIVEATDEVDGSYELAVYCTVCGEEISRETVVVPAGHEWNDGVITTAPTCTTAGVKTYTCTTCGETYTESVPATGHTAGTAVIENYVKVTADADGSYDSVTYCTVCGEEISRSHTVIAAYGSGSAEVIDWATVLACANSSNDTNTTTVEDVVIEEPIEPTDTETEDDGEEEPAAEPVVEAETPAETNPTTGVAILLMPMAIAALAVASSKRK